jgi:tetratricopeptide (TPR) repeat protein
MSNQQRKLYEKALKDRQQTISKNKKLNAAFNAGMEAKRLKDFATAVSYLKEATEIDPAQHVVWANLAELYSALFSTKVGDARKETEDLAIEAYHKALAIKPDPAYHNNLGLTLIKTGLLEEGSAELEIAAQLAPENAGTYYFNLGAVMVNSGNTERAIEAFRKATEVRPDYADAFYQLATALVGTAQMKDDGSIVPAAGTVEAYQKYLNLEPEGSYAPSAQAMVQSLTGKLETVFEQPNKRRN